MQNWNDGKAQEYKDRKVYDIGASMQHRFGAAPQAEAAPAAPEASGDRLMLFTTKTCPKCVMAKKFLSDAGISYELVIADDTPDVARKYGVRQAPTLLVLSGETEVQRVENPSNIRIFAEDHAVRP